MKKPRILILDADEAAVSRHQQALADLDGPEFVHAATPAEASESLADSSFDLLVAALDPALPADSRFLDEVRALDAELPIIVVAARPKLESATASLRAGVGDYLAAPVAAAALEASARRLLGSRRRGAEYELLRRQVERPYSFDDMIGGCPPMRRVFETIEQVAHSDVDVLVVGETGTGKELVGAVSIAAAAARRDRLSRSIAARFRKTCWRANSSATRKAPSPAPRAGESVCWNSPTGARSFSTSSASCR